EEIDGTDITDQDIDSNADMDPKNDDEDEDDNGEAFIEIYDLALINQIRENPIYAVGDTISFDMTIVNQGNMAVSNIEVANHLPSGYIFDPAINPGWSDNKSVSYFYTIPGTLYPGESTVITLKAIIVYVDVDEFYYRDVAEIVGGEDSKGNLYADSDSTPDGDPTNDGTPMDDQLEDQDDEDDHDPEIFDLLSEFSFPCTVNCEIACQGLLNISLDENCMAEITPSMAGIDIHPLCNGYYDLKIFIFAGDELIDDFVDLSHVGKDLRFEITEPECGNKCQGMLNVEFKLPPQIQCPPDQTLSCGALDIIGVPPAIGSCADFEVFLFSEESETLVCDPDYTSIVKRTYKAVDEMGNESECSHTIHIARIDLNSIIFPEWKSVGTANAISCSDPIIEFDANGIPLPWPSDPLTGSGSGVPILCDPLVTNGLLCPLTGSGNGVPLIPGNTQAMCSAATTYTDIELPGSPCVRQIMRTWEVREWWCSGENTKSALQLIEIVDDQAPEFDCPADFSVSTNDECAGSVTMPPVSPIDGCGQEVSVAIEYPLGRLEQNGGNVELALGENIVTYIASDACYNQSSCEVTVTVRDNTEPVAICDQFTVISVSQSGTSLITAEALDDGSWDECGLERIEVARMDTTCFASDTLFDESVHVCCADVGQTIMVIFQAVDFSGNTNRCMVSVEVDNKSIPVLTCPEDVTVDCRDAYDFNNLGISFGEANIDDNCTSSYDLVETVSDDVNQCNIGQITRLFEMKDASGNVLRSCKQLITITNNEPFVGANIIWPLDYDMIGGCELADLSPELLPDGFGFPVYTSGNDECSLLGYDYEDQIFQAVPGSGECAHIERTWSVINWCSQTNGLFDKWVSPRPQIIKLINDISPELDDQTDILIESQNIDCNSGDIELVRTATDDCNNPLYWSYTMKDDSGTIVQQGSSDTLSGVFDIGFYTVEWTVQDGCGNFDVDFQDIEIRNIKSPSPICIQGLSANLVLMDLNNDGLYDAEMVELLAENFDGGSYHTCNNPFVLSLSQDTSVTSVIYDCDSLGIQSIQLWATDVVTGAQDYCVTYIDIQDNNGQNVCPEDDNKVVIEGDIFTEEKEEVENVVVGLGVEDIQDLTDEFGQYAFPNMPKGGQYNIEPSKDTEYLNGVSTLDLIVIQRHILGLEYLDSPYKLIAADINNSADVSSIDLIELRKLVLGVYETLPENSSWRFVDAEYQFPDNYNPWLESMPENYVIDDLQSDMNIDFIGVKIGDVNGSAIANSQLKSRDIENRNLESLTFLVEDKFIRKGETATIEVTSSNYNDISGWQGTYEFDPAKITITDVIPGALDISLDENFNVLSQEEGWASWSYHKQVPESFDEDEVLFQIIVEADSDMNASDIFELSSVVTPLEAYRDYNTLMGINFESFTMDQEAKIHSVSPNPWIESTTVRFSLPQGGETEWQYYDVSGRLIYKENIEFTAGEQSLTIERNKLNTSGVVYIKLITDNTIAQYKMLLVD
ncbi:MAG: T9SS type A sorting domain-containing protein, partial [Bacteroidia bacterium]|nr:T9SS type A sorting domain-containing protein [Bacteroidia bacterium]